MTNQSVSDKQLDDNIWELPDYSLHYNSSSEYDSNNSSIIDVSEVIPASPMPGFDPLWETENDFNEVLMTYDITLESTDIIYATLNFHRKPMFSNVVVSANDGEKDKIGTANIQVLPSSRQRTIRAHSCSLVRERW
ncbi:hypothetical protein C2G38_2170277 [Gigaspora rosea]|uniref:Uncharacterized protein n=1 Tax=Gigaspora rosea TaxID=44941 RepID=A0A397VP92_9GLOM|nr:hypothetical protein C2G38_2170277 [Gigaspora rosea]